VQIPQNTNTLLGNYAAVLENLTVYNHKMLSYRGKTARRICAFCNGVADL